METKYSEHPSMFRNNPLGFILAILLIPVAIGILILLWWYLQCKSTKLEFSGNDLILEKGLLSKERMGSGTACPTKICDQYRSVQLHHTQYANDPEYSGVTCHRYPGPPPH